MELVYFTPRREYAATVLPTAKSKPLLTSVVKPIAAVPVNVALESTRNVRPVPISVPLPASVVKPIAAVPVNVALESTRNVRPVPVSVPLPASVVKPSPLDQTFIDNLVSPVDEESGDMFWSILPVSDVITPFALNSVTNISQAETSYSHLQSQPTLVPSVLPLTSVGSVITTEAVSAMNAEQVRDYYNQQRDMIAVYKLQVQVSMSTTDICYLVTRPDEFA